MSTLHSSKRVAETDAQLLANLIWRISVTRNSYFPEALHEVMNAVAADEVFTAKEAELVLAALDNLIDFSKECLK